MGRLRSGHGEMLVDTDQSVTVSAANTDYAVNGANVSKGTKRYVVLDPDAGANPDLKFRLGGGRWLLQFSGHLTAASAVCQAHLYTTNGAAGSETETAISIDTPAGGGPITLTELIDVPQGSYADVELKVSNETNTNNITVESGSRFTAIGIDERGYRAAAN